MAGSDLSVVLESTRTHNAEGTISRRARGGVVWEVRRDDDHDIDFCVTEEDEDDEWNTTWPCA